MQFALGGMDAAVSRSACGGQVEFAPCANSGTKIRHGGWILVLSPLRLVHGLSQYSLGRVEEVRQLVKLVLGNSPGRAPGRFTHPHRFRAGNSPMWEKERKFRVGNTVLWEKTGSFRLGCSWI